MPVFGQNGGSRYLGIDNLVGGLGQVRLGRSLFSAWLPVNGLCLGAINVGQGIEYGSNRCPSYPLVLVQLSSRRHIHSRRFAGDLFYTDISVLSKIRIENFKSIVNRYHSPITPTQKGHALSGRHSDREYGGYHPPRAARSS